MPKQLLPNERKWIQSNDGQGTVAVAYGVDFWKKRGHFSVSDPIKKVIDQQDDLGTGNNQFNSYAQTIVKYGSRYLAAGDDIFKTGLSQDPTAPASWSLDETSGSPSAGNTVSTSVVFDGLFLTVDGNDIDSYNGSSWSSWWQGTRGQSALTTGSRIFLKVGGDGNLYILNDGYVHKVLSNGSGTGAITLASSGNGGTLDFTAEPYEFTCVETTSTRLHIGYRDTSSNKGGIIEWDMSANSNTANKTHKLGSAALCIAIRDDVPFALMQGGDVKYFNGVSYQDYKGMRLPKINGIYDDDLVHPNGWAIIDDMVHYLIRGNTGLGQTLAEKTKNDVEFPSAVYCLDPEIGLYPRFLLSYGQSTQDDYAQHSVAEVGALFALNNLDSKSKFMASYEVYTNGTGTKRAVMAAHDPDKTNDARGFVLYEPVERANSSKQVESFFKKMDAGNKARLFYREHQEDSVFAAGTWLSATTFNTTDNLSNVDDKWIMLIKTGLNAGAILRVESVTASDTVYSVIFKDSTSHVAANDSNAVVFINMRWFGDITSTTLDHKTLTIPSNQSREVQIMIELQQTGGTLNEFDYSVLDT